MPGSMLAGKAEIKNWINSHKEIVKIIDVGAGSGTYPKFIDWDDGWVDNPTSKRARNHFWTAIEIFEPYVEKFNLREYYNEIIIGNIYKIWPPAESFDLIIFGDILEHLPKNQAKEVLDRAIEEYRHVIVSIPTDGRDSMVHYDNEAEKHLSTWTFEELKDRANWEIAFEQKGIGVFIK